MHGANESFSTSLTLASPQQQHPADGARLVELRGNARGAGIIFDTRELRRLQALKIVAELRSRADELKVHRAIEIDVYWTVAAGHREPAGGALVRRVALAGART